MNTGFPYSAELNFPIKTKHAILMSAKIDLNWSVAGNVRVYVGQHHFARWFRTHTPLYIVLQQAFESPSLAQFELSVERAQIARIDLDTGLVEVKPPQR